MSYNQIYRGFAYSLYMYIHVFQQEKGYVVDEQNIASTNENDQAQHCMIYKAE